MELRPPLLVSPDRKLLATEFMVTAASWISVSSLETGKQFWQTNPSNGFVGFTGMAWAPDSRSLLVAKHKDDPEFPGPGGLWKCDALTGKQKVWKYPGKDVWGAWSSPDGKTLAVSVGNELELVNASTGDALFRLKLTPTEQNTGRFIGNDRFIFYGSRLSLINTRTHQVRSIGSSAEERTILTSPTVPQGVPIHAGIYYDGQLLDLQTGTKTMFGEVAPDVWLPKDIVR